MFAIPAASGTFNTGLKPLLAAVEDDRAPVAVPMMHGRPRSERADFFSLSSLIPQSMQLVAKTTAVLTTSRRRATVLPLLGVRASVFSNCMNRAYGESRGEEAISRTLAPAIGAFPFQ